MDPLNTTKVISPATYLIAGVALLLAGTIIGAIVGAFTDPYFPSSLSNAKKGYETGFTAAKTLVEKSSLGAMIKTPDDIRSLIGTVTAIGKDNFTLHIFSGNPFADPSLADRSITLSTSTIVNSVEKTLSVSQTEMATSTKITQGTTTSPKIFPVVYVPIPASISDIKVGDTVDVFASDNIKMTKEFTASEVQILPKTPVL